jgi:hypothetical protein
MGAEWEIAGVADMNQDGRSDILWGSTTGTANIWLMNGTDFIGVVTPSGSMGAEWNLTGLGDFTGDGVADPLWIQATGQAQEWDLGLAGGDTLEGGDGRDRFVIDVDALHGGQVTIADFLSGVGGDQLDLDALLQNLGYGGSDPLADQTLRLVQDGADTHVQIHAINAVDPFITITTLLSTTVGAITSDNIIF